MAMSRRKKRRTPAERERSAGVIVYRRAGDGVLFLLLDYGRYWDFPKGHLEPGEDDTAAALRELREETGIDRIDLHAGFSREIRYFFRKGPTLVNKRVVFFLGETSDEAVTISHEHEGHRWADLAAARGLVTHANARAVLDAAADTLGLG